MYDGDLIEMDTNEHSGKHINCACTLPYESFQLCYAPLRRKHLYFKRLLSPLHVLNHSYPKGVHAVLVIIAMSFHFKKPSDRNSAQLTIRRFRPLVHTYITVNLFEKLMTFFASHSPGPHLPDQRLHHHCHLAEGEAGTSQVA